MTDQDRRRLERRAAAFRGPDRAMEHLERIRFEDPDTFATLGPNKRIALGHYQAAREAARALGRDVG